MSPYLIVLTDFFAVLNHALSYAAGLAVPLPANLLLLQARHEKLLAVDGQAFTLSPHYSVVQRLLRAINGTLEMVLVSDKHV